MAEEKNKQNLANLIQCEEILVKMQRLLYDDESLKLWAIELSLNSNKRIDALKKKLQDSFSIDYDSADAKTKVIKEGSVVEVLVNHMKGMKGSVATIKSYSLPANLSDITMMDGMKMDNHKWMTNNEVKLK